MAASEGRYRGWLFDVGSIHIEDDSVRELMEDTRFPGFLGALGVEIIFKRHKAGNFGERTAPRKAENMESIRKGKGLVISRHRLGKYDLFIVTDLLPDRDTLSPVTEVLTEEVFGVRYPAQDLFLKVKSKRTKKHTQGGPTLVDTHGQVKEY